MSVLWAWKVAGRTDRPRVYELMEMPLERFREAQAGLTITLGDTPPRIEAEKSGDESAPAMGKRAQQTRRQRGASMNSTYL